MRWIKVIGLIIMHNRWSDEEIELSGLSDLIIWRYINLFIRAIYWSLHVIWLCYPHESIANDSTTLAYIFSLSEFLLNNCINFTCYVGTYWGNNNWSIAWINDCHLEIFNQFYIWIICKSNNQIKIKWSVRASCTRSKYNRRFIVSNW